MLNGQIKPIIVKIVKYRLRYPYNIPINKPLRVISYDIKRLLVTDEKVIKVYRVLWKDIELVESEKIVQVAIVQQEGHTKVISRSKDRKPLFSSKLKFS